MSDESPRAGLRQSPATSPKKEAERKDKRKSKGGEEAGGAEGATEEAAAAHQRVEPDAASAVVGV